MRVFVALGNIQLTLISVELVQILMKVIVVLTADSHWPTLINSHAIVVLTADSHWPTLINSHSRLTRVYNLLFLKAEHQITKRLRYRQMHTRLLETLNLINHPIP
jgi:hypothetical protein